MSSLDKKVINKEAKTLVEWFEENSRPLPWRQNRKPYPIWISEIMLQQTTVQAVIPFFEKFMKRFPSESHLAKAPLEAVYERWAGLGYYSRARNIHKAAQVITDLGRFPKTHDELLKIPGFGDYTARAVSSQAFGEKVGVVDGNVIRVLSRRYGEAFEHWKTSGKKQLQVIADEYAQVAEPRLINQAFMELGATICRPVNPTCLLCPIKKNCVARQEDKIESLPIKKPKRATEIWQWQVEVFERQGKYAFVTNEYAPFLKKQLVLPGKVKMVDTPPKNFDFQHAITHHKIYIKVKRKKTPPPKKQGELQWISKNEISKKIPFSVIHKALEL